MGDTTYPGVMLTRVNPNITEDQVIDYVSSRIGSSPTLYTNGQPEVTIYNAPKASGEEQVVRALVNGILLPFDEIRRRFGSCLMQGQQVFIQTPDMGVPRKVDGDFTTEGKFLHNHIVEGQGSFAALPLLKHGIDKKLENVTALQHTLLYNDTKQSVHINNLYNAGSVIVYGNTNRGHRSLNEGFSRMEIVFNTRMDALQAICKLNLNPTFSKKGKTNAFLLNENCRPCTLKLDVGLGLDGSILDITRLLTRKKYIPLEILNSEIFAIDGLRKKTYYCFDCKSSYIILGVGPNLDWLAATCTCPTYQSEYTWNEELFFRIRCWPQNEQNPVVRITRGLVPLYRDVMEFKNTALAAFLNESNLQKKTLELSQALGKIVAQEVVELKPSGSVTHVMQMLRVQVPETKVWSSEGSKSFKKAKLFYTEENALSVCVNKSIVYEINSVPSSEHPLSEVTLVAELLPHNNVFRTDDKILIVPQQMENAQQAFLNALRTWSNYDHMLKQPNDYLPATLESYSTCKDFTTKLPITRGDRFHDCFTWLFEIKTANSPTWNLLAKLLDSCYVGVNINVKINGGRSRNYPARIIGTYECGPNEIILETILFLNFNKISNITSTCSYNVWIISKAVKGVPGQLASLANNNVDFGTSTALVPSRVAVFEDENIDVGSTSDLSSVINVWRQRPNRNLPLLDLLMQPRKTAFYPTPSPTTQVPSASHCHDIQMLLKSLNDSQHAAVVGFFNNLLTMTQGPPGTGKTTTIATGILSLVGLSKGIVVGCCQSNYATNVLLEAISKKNKKYSKCPKTIVRMQSFTQQNLMTKLENQTSKLDDEYQLHLLVRNHPKWKANFEIEKILAKQKLLGEALLTSEERTTLSELADEITTEILASADIILCTVSCASDGRIIAALRQAHLIGRHFLGMVVDKASLLTVPSVLPILILNPHRLWLVGDDCQLSPTVSNEASRLACLDVSWFEFLRLTPYGKKDGCLTFLSIQYRMPVPSANLISTFMYHNTLRSDESVHKRMYTGDIYRTCFKQLKNVHSAWIAYDAYGERQQEGSSSFFNPIESILVRELLLKLERCNERMDAVTVICMYENQMEQIRALVNSMGPHFNEVTVCTVDAAQGKENEIVILSMVRSNFENKVGFLSDRRRLNVAMSRHRKCLFVVGDLPCFMRSNCLDLKTIIGIMKEQKVSVTFYSCPQYSSPTPMFTETISEFLLRLGLV